MKNPWKTVKENIVFDNPKYGFQLHNDDVINPLGNPGKFMYLTGHEYVVIIPVTPDKKIVMVRQWRYTVGCECLELPAGSLNDKEDVIVAAKRELEEETGTISNDLQEIYSYMVSNGVARLKGHVILAKNVTFSGQIQREETETTVPETYTYSELKEMIDKNIINDDRSIIGLLLVEKYL